MNYIQEHPKKDLKKYVRCYWSLENQSDDSLYFTILPDGFFDFLVCYSEEELNSIMLTGLWTEKAYVTIKPRVQVFGVQFRLQAVESIIRQSIAPILNKIKIIEKNSCGLQTLTEILPVEVFAFFEDHLNSITSCLSDRDPRKYHLLNLIDQSKGNERVEYYSNATHWSQRQINRYFQATFGLPLKSYCSIRKGASSYSQIKRGRLYPEQNYFDQSHFIKEIKRITGATPKELKKNKNDRLLQFSIIPDS